VEKSELLLPETAIDEVETFVDDSARKSKENEIKKPDFVELNKGNSFLSNLLL